VDQPQQQLGETITSTNDLNVPASVVSSPVAPIDSMRDSPSSASSATTSASTNDSQQVEQLKGKAKFADLVLSKVMKSPNNQVF
jgi:hypothetical protein